MLAPNTKSRKKSGDGFELLIRDLLLGEIEADRFWARSESCKVFWKKGYFSKDRNSEIVFDVSVELYLPGQQDYSLLVLVECKDYQHPVPVDDAEEFFSKVQQVAAANVKAVIASTAAFQRGARDYARSKGMGLLRYFDPGDFKWELLRSPSASARSTNADEAGIVDTALEMQGFESVAFDLYLQSPSRDTNCLWDFVEDIVLSAGIPTEQVRKIANERRRLTNQVPFLERGEIEGRSLDVLAEIKYENGEVNLGDVCDSEQRKCGLTYMAGVDRQSAQAERTALGRITFDPLVIEIFANQDPSQARDRFTLAHELGHHVLQHGQHMVREYCDESDFILNTRVSLEGTDVARMEFQANYFASNLLMPRMPFVQDFRALVLPLDILDRGRRALYVDNQPCNIKNYELVVRPLAKKYGVSKTAATMRSSRSGYCGMDVGARG